MIRRTFMAGVAALLTLTRTGQPKKTEIQRLQSLIDAHRISIPQGDTDWKLWESLRIEGGAEIFVDRLSSNKKAQYQNATLDERASLVGLWSRQEIQKYIKKNPGGCFDNDRNWPLITDVVDGEIFIELQFAYGAKNTLTQEQAKELQAIVDEAYGDPIPNNFQGRVPPSGKTLEQINKERADCKNEFDIDFFDATDLCELKKRLPIIGKVSKLSVEYFIASNLDNGYYFVTHEQSPTPKIEGVFEGRLSVNFTYGASATPDSNHPSVAVERRSAIIPRGWFFH